jgi:hypothetical protein
MEVGVQTAISAIGVALLGTVSFFLARFATKVDKLSDSVAVLSQGLAVLDSEHHGKYEALASTIDEREERSKIHWTTQRVFNKEARARISKLEAKP